MAALSGCNGTTAPEDDFGFEGEYDSGGSSGVDASRASNATLLDAGGQSTTTATPTGTVGDAAPPGAAPGMAAIDGAAPSSGPVAPACMGRAGETVCDRTIMIRCGASGNIESQQNCMTEGRCRAGLAAGTCASCEPGQHQCTGSLLEECSSAGQYQPKQMCESAALCSDENRSCDPSKCTAGAYKCTDGALLKCSTDLTSFELVEECEAELCDEQAGKCHGCVPNSTSCADATLLTCSPEGTGPVEEPCSDPTPLCTAGKCVQCTTDEDCAPASECTTSVCNTGTGMCEEGPFAPARTPCGEDQICGNLGNCIDCLTSEDCPGSQICNLLLSCVDRAPLEVELLGPSLFLPGAFTITLDAGYSLALDSIEAGDEGGEVSISERLLERARITTSTRAGTALIAKSEQARTFTISGPAAAGCAPIVNSEFQVTLAFENTESETDCDSLVLVLEARP